MLQDTQDIFHQLARVDGTTGVKVIVENHDAWLHNQDADEALGAALRIAAARTARDPDRASRIEKQRQRLQRMVTQFRARNAAAS